MKIDFSKDFNLTLGEQVRYIAKDKPIAARKFHIDVDQYIIIHYNN